jgi:predicted ATPase/DNA-binding SARP family transcriptional activator
MQPTAPNARRVEVQIRLLGGFDVRVDGRAVPERWRLKKAKTLIKLLSLAAGHRLHRDLLVDRLWPRHLGAAAANNLHQAMHAARSALAAAGAPPSVLVLRDDVVALCPDGGLVVDAEMFLHAAANAKDAPGLRAALALWTGDLLPEDGCDEWGATVRDRLTEERARLTTELASRLLETGAAEEAVALVEPLAADRPFDEPLHRTLVEALAATKRRADALRAYERLRLALHHELGTEPEASIRDLHARLGGDPGRRGNNLPAATTSFVGRGRELDEIDATLFTRRALTLTGPGGSGKTRLAIELARRRVAREDHPDGVWLVELASLREPDLVASAVAVAIGLRLPGEHAEVAATVEGLRSRRVLLVLDNCEHLVEPAAALAAAVLAGCPAVTVLATSREPLGIPGEAIWRVPSLQLPAPGPPADPDELGRLESVQLFVERARLAVPDFPLDPSNARSVAVICRRLDGIPLAIELAAARVAHLSAAELADRLGDALGLLSYRAAAPLDRQKTLAATIDWSYDLLTATERALFRRLSVFAGGFALDAAEFLAADAIPDPVGTLSRLIDKSLVVADTTTKPSRYRLLEVVRQYALGRLDPEERAVCRRRHRDHYADRAEHLDSHCAGSIVTEPSRWFDAERDNLRAALGAALADDPAQALRLAAAMWRFWMSRGMLAEGVRWLRRALDGCPESSMQRASALYGLAVLHTRLGDAAPLDAVGAELVAIARAVGGRAELAAARHHQTVLALMTGDWPATDELEARTLADAVGVPTVLTSALHLAAILAMSRGQLDLAATRLDAARAMLATIRKESPPFFVTMSLAVLVERRAGWACPVGEETMFLARRVGAPQAAGHLRLTDAVHARLRGDLAGALRSLAEALATFSSIGDRYGEALSIAQRGHALRWADDLRGSRDCFEIAESLRRGLGDLRGVALALDGQALADAAAGRPERALELGNRALTGMRRCGDVAGMGFTSWNLAVIEVLLDDPVSAVELLTHPAVDATSPGWHRAVGWYQLLLADVLGRHGGDPDPAVREAQRIFDLLGERAGLAELHELRAKQAQSRRV